MNYAYSPHTGEFINVEVPAPWMLTTTIAPPAFDPQNAGCFFQNGAWVLVSTLPKILLDVQTTQLNLMDSSYDIANAQPIAYMSTSFQADKGSTTLMSETLGVATAAQVASLTWWDINNAGVVMTLAQFVELTAAIFSRGQGYFAHKQAQKAAIRNAKDVATVQAVVW